MQLEGYTPSINSALKPKHSHRVRSIPVGQSHCNGNIRDFSTIATNLAI